MERWFITGGELARSLRLSFERSGEVELLKGDVDLLSRRDVHDFFTREKPDCVILTSLRSGGITANQKFPADFLHDNLLAETHVLESARDARLLYLSSSCCYPRIAPQPMRPDALMTGALEPTSLAYAVGKLAGLTLTQAYRKQYGTRYICGIPATPFGPDDSFDAQESHVITSLMRRMDDARRAAAASIELWGTGSPVRDFIFMEDLAAACRYVLKHYDEAVPINLVGDGAAISILDLSHIIKKVVGYEGEIRCDVSKPDGAPEKRLDPTALKGIGWRQAFSFEEALQQTWSGFLRREGASSNLLKSASPRPA